MENPPSDQNQDKNREIFAYLRVSTANQSGGLASQELAIQKYCQRQGIHNYRIFRDEAVSGAKTSRPALDAMMSEIGKGKCKQLIVFAFSRFSRSCTHLLKSVEYLQENNTRLISISEDFDTSTPIGRTLLTVLGALAQLERDLVRERVMAGLQRAREAGKHIGRKKTRPSDTIRLMLKSGMSYRTIARCCSVSHGSIYAEKKQMLEEEKQKKEQAEKLKEEQPTLSLVTPNSEEE